MKWILYQIVQPIIETLLFVIHDTHGECRLKSCVPKHEIDAIVRTFYPAVVAFFESEEGKREFAEWKKKQEEKAKTNKPTEKSA